MQKLRFKMYKDDWITYKLGDIGTTYTGLSGKSAIDFGHGEARYVTYLNVFANPIANPLLVEQIEIDSKQNTVKYGDIFFTTSSETPEEVGLSSVWLGNSCNIYLNSFCFGYRPKMKLNPFYMAYMLRSPKIRRDIVLLAQGISRYNISKNKLMEQVVTIPSLQEQEKIGGFFSAFDKLIMKQQEKIGLLKDLKKGYLQKMFPKKGANIPEIRFKGFTDDWEQCELQNIYGKIRNAFVGTATPYYAPQGNFYLESNNIKDGQINRNTEIFINDEFYYKQKDNWLKTGDIVMVQSGHVGHSAVIPPELNNSAAHALIMFAEPKVKVYPFFLNYQYLTSSFKKAIDSITTGNTIKHILSSEMKSFKVLFTCIEEQIKIGEVFQKLDSLITLHQHKLKSLEDLKKGYMQRIFT